MIKLISQSKTVKVQCSSCMGAIDCYEIVMKTEYGSFPLAITVCKDCLKELQKQIKEQLDDRIA